MRKVMGTVVIGVFVLAGCGGSDKSESAETSDESGVTATSDAVTTTSLTRAAVGSQIGMNIDPQQKLGYLHSDPERIAELAGEYCADLTQSDQATADENLTASLTGLIQGYGGGNSDRRVATASASLMDGQVAEQAVELLCPDVGAGEFLPPS